MSFFQKLLSRGLGARASRASNELLMWSFPLAVGAGWLLWPALDLEWKMELGLAADPDYGI